MYDNKRGKWLESPGKENEQVRGHPLLNEEKLADDVATALQKIYLELGEGLPDCVYQLKLHNELTKQGFQLQAEKVMLNHSIKPESARSLMVTNDVLVSEYVTYSRTTDQIKKRLTFDLEKKNYASGLLNISIEGKKKISITEVKQTNTYH